MNSMRHVRSRWLAYVSALAVVVGVVGCGPAVQAIPPVTVHTASNVVVGAWKTIGDAAAGSEATQKYKVKMDVTVAQGPIQSLFSVYGSINAPDYAFLGFHSHTESTWFYQQGKAAYIERYKHWVSAPAFKNLDAFKGYAGLVKWAEASHIPVYNLPVTYVVDEYCHVYQATLPIRPNDKNPLWSLTGLPNPGSHKIVYTFYVGETSGNLREVDTSTVGALPDVGGMEVNTTTVFFSLGKSAADVVMPNDLYGQLVGMAHQKL